MAKSPTVQRLSRQVAETAICEVEYKGKTISEWCELFCKGDLVEVIKCKDCEYYGGITFSNICRRWSALNIKNCTKPDDYCSYGKRKDGEENGL